MKKLGKIILVLVLIALPILSGVLIYKQTQKASRTFRQLVGDAVLNLAINSVSTTLSNGQSGPAHLAA